ncbi:hypothetical protein ABW21_db0209421 [Orbilia brochopaga]|nr:hypothetical protein ABW21_db0209421 [Drechslerella brochopaga]
MQHQYPPNQQNPQHPQNPQYPQNPQHLQNPQAYTANFAPGAPYNHPSNMNNMGNMSTGHGTQSHSNLQQHMAGMPYNAQNHGPYPQFTGPYPQQYHNHAPRNFAQYPGDLHFGPTHGAGVQPHTNWHRQQNPYPTYNQLQSHWNAQQGYPSTFMPGQHQPAAGNHWAQSSFTQQTPHNHFYNGHYTQPQYRPQQPYFQHPGPTYPQGNNSFSGPNQHPGTWQHYNMNPQHNPMPMQNHAIFSHNPHRFPTTGTMNHGHQKPIIAPRTIYRAVPPQPDKRRVREVEPVFHMVKSFRGSGKSAAVASAQEDTGSEKAGDGDTAVEALDHSDTTTDSHNTEQESSEQDTSHGSGTLAIRRAISLPEGLSSFREGNSLTVSKEATRVEADFGLASIAEALEGMNMDATAGQN